MKLMLLIFSILLTFPVNSVSYNCNASPSELLKIRSCCKLPNFVSRKMENHCFEESRGKEENCMINCYFKDSKILFNGVLDKTALRRIIYDNNPTYSTHIPVAVDKCQFNETESLSQSVVDYFDCVYDHLAQHCEEFIESPQCEEVKQQFQFCKINCSLTPSWKPCCDLKLLSDDITKANNQKRRLCESKFSKELEQKCILDTKKSGDSKNITKILNGKPENIFRLFENSSFFSENWETSMKKASEVCASNIKGLNVDSNFREKKAL